jgi:hypothetical protein
MRRKQILKLNFGNWDHNPQALDARNPPIKAKIRL